jgi:hypothetical protein
MTANFQLLQLQFLNKVLQKIIIVLFLNVGVFLVGRGHLQFVTIVEAGSPHDAGGPHFTSRLFCQIIAFAKHLEIALDVVN